MRKLVGTVSVVVAFALLIVALSPAAIGAQTPPTIPGGIYQGTAVDTLGGCSEGELTSGPKTGLRLNPHGTVITTFVVYDITTPLGDFSSFDIPVSIPIDSDGRFDGTFDPLNLGLAIIHLEGQFDGDSVSGTFSVVSDDALDCAGTFSADGTPPPPQPPVLYSGAIDATDDQECGFGDLTMTVSGDQLSVIAVEIEDFIVHGASTSGSATFAQGTVPLAENGSFGWTYFPGSEPGQEIAVIGQFVSSNVQGLVTVSPSTCGPIQYFAGRPLDQGGGGPLSDFGPSADGGSLGRGGESVLLPPGVGAGPLSDSGLSIRWALAAGAIGVASLAIGAAVRRRVRSVELEDS